MPPKYDLLAHNKLSSICSNLATLLPISSLISESQHKSTDQKPKNGSNLRFTIRSSGVRCTNEINIRELYSLALCSYRHEFDNNPLTFKVASVYYRPRLLSIRRTNLSLEMLRAGWAITYDQSGGVYGREGKEKYMEVEAKAQYVTGIIS